MTDQITDQDRRTAIDVAEAIERGDYPMATMWPIMARVILATVDAPAPTLSEEWRDILEKQDAGEAVSFSGLLARTDQMEHYFEEARAEAKTWREQDENDCEAYMEELASVRETLAMENHRADRIAKERDEARDEVEGINFEKEVREAINDHYDRYATQERAESNAESLDPAAVKPGEAWIVEFYGEKRNALKDRDDSTPWNTANTGGRLSCVRNEDVTLLTRLVPAPRTITNADDLDRLPHNSVILSADNDAWQKSSETSLWASAWWTTSDGEPSMWASDRLCDEDHPATVLWEPGA